MFVLLLAVLVPVLCLAILLGADRLERGLDDTGVEVESGTGLAT